MLRARRPSALQERSRTASSDRITNSRTGPPLAGATKARLSPREAALGASQAMVVPSLEHASRVAASETLATSRVSSASVATTIRACPAPRESLTMTAIAVPVGVQSNANTEELLSAFSLWLAREATSSTKRSGPELTPLPALSFLRAMHATCLPPADHSNDRTSVDESSKRTRPEGQATSRLGEPSTSERDRNANVPPSGDHRGCESCVAVVVRASASPPGKGIRHRFDMPPRLATRVKTTERPSGAICASPMTPAATTPAFWGAAAAAKQALVLRTRRPVAPRAITASGRAARSWATADSGSRPRADSPGVRRLHPSGR